MRRSDAPEERPRLNAYFFVIYSARFSHPCWGLAAGFATILGVTALLLMFAQKGGGLGWVGALGIAVVFAGALATLARGPIVGLILVRLASSIKKTHVGGKVMSNISFGSPWVIVV